MGTKALAGASGNSGVIKFPDSQVGAELCVTEFNLQEMAQEEETTNSCSAGTKEFEYGSIYIEGTIEADLDLSAHPFGSPPGFVPGESILGLTFYEFADTANAPVGEAFILSFNEIVISQCTVTCPASGKVHYSLSFKSVGSYGISGLGFSLSRGT